MLNGVYQPYIVRESLALDCKEGSVHQVEEWMIWMTLTVVVLIQGQK